MRKNNSRYIKIITLYIHCQAKKFEGEREREKREVLESPIYLYTLEGIIQINNAIESQINE